MPQNYYFSAKQNAKRLHGGPRKLHHHVQSRSHPGTQYSMPTKNKTKKQKKQPKTQDVTAIVKSAVSAAMKAVPQANPKRNTFLGDLGQFAGNGISKIFGLGAYKLTRNSLYSSQTGAQVPYMHSTSESVVFRHREYIGEVNSSVAWTTQQYQVNPGLSSTFPYLATLASCFQEYKFRGLIFEFKSTGADALVNGTNTSMGTVGLVAQYRADAVPLASKQEFMNEMWSTDCKTSENCILPIECAPKENPMAVQYVRTGPPTGDQKLYDLCVLTVATTGSPGVNIVGELWASYEIEFYKPTLTPSGGILASDHFLRTGVSGSTPLGSIATSVAINGIGCGVTSNTIIFPANTAGKFLITVVHVGGAVAWAPGAVSATNATLVYCWNNGASGYIASPPGAVTTGVCTLSAVVYITGAIAGNASVSFSGTVFPTNSVIDVSIVECSDNYA